MKNLKALIQSGQFDSGIKDNLETAANLSKNSNEYKKRLILREKLQKNINDIMENNQLDAIVFPHQKRLVVPVGETQVERNGVLAAVTGFPSI